MSDDELRALYRTARLQEAPSAEDRRAVRAALAVALAAPLAAPAAAAAASGGVAAAGTLGNVAISFGVGMTLGLMVIGGTLTTRALVASPPPEVEWRAAPTPREIESAPQRAVAVLPAVLPSASQAEEARPRGPAARPAPAEPTAASASSLAAESKGLAEVQRALAAGDTQRALDLLAAQEQEFGPGALAEERAAARVVALCSEDAPEADAARARFTQSYRTSPLAQRVAAACQPTQKAHGTER